MSGWTTKTTFKLCWFFRSPRGNLGGSISCLEIPAIDNANYHGASDNVEVYLPHLVVHGVQVRCWEDSSQKGRVLRAVAQQSSTIQDQRFVVNICHWQRGLLSKIIYIYMFLAVKGCSFELLQHQPYTLAGPVCRIEIESNRRWGSAGHCL